MIKAGILGTDEHIESYLDLLKQLNSFHLVGLHDINDDKVLDIHKKYGVRIFTHPDELFNEVDALITTTGFNSYQCLRNALRQSKHIFIEKPAEYSINQTRELINLSDEAEVVVQLGFRHRYNPAFLAARPFIDPQVRMIQARRMLTHKEDRILDPVQDIMLHDVDNILSVVNSNIRKISAYGISTNEKRPDVVNAFIEFHNGCIANLTASTIAGTETQDAVFYNPKDYIEVDFKHHKASRYSKRSDNNMTLFGENKNDLNCEHIPVKNANVMADELEAFSRSILKISNPEVSLENTSRTMAVIREIKSRLKLTANCF
ncbi:MAG: Gfo/Idh/MocA family oxidoreductase [Bacteroidota bacterium]|nr:Gfo/Idh/MocA family oxidoreductase [Bacteroidota bacterium]